VWRDEYTGGIELQIEDWLITEGPMQRGHHVAMEAGGYQ
jgi:hypothetical protein